MVTMFTSIYNYEETVMYECPNCASNLKDHISEVTMKPITQYGNVAFKSVSYNAQDTDDFAKKFYEDAYKASIEIVGGEEYIISAVMHADERNKAM